MSSVAKNKVFGCRGFPNRLVDGDVNVQEQRLSRSSPVQSLETFGTVRKPQRAKFEIKVALEPMGVGRVEGRREPFQRSIPSPQSSS